MRPCDVTWFERLFGFRERSRAQVHKHLFVDGTRLHSRKNGCSYEIGALETPSLGELRTRAPATSTGSVRLRNIVGTADGIHRDPANAGALFQAASQFNLLEMTSPEVTPEDGVTGYVHDHTQGPACAMAAAAATVYRNYFVPVGDAIGQTSDRQIDCLRDVHDLLADDDAPLWRMRNGYALPSRSSIARFNRRFAAVAVDERGRDRIRAALRVGVHRDVEVTRARTRHRVSQCYCSALPVAYSRVVSEEWKAFARLVLEATYEATLLAAAENAARTGNRTVFLTMVGGGVFGNRHEWIRAAMSHGLRRLAQTPLDVRVVHLHRVPTSYRAWATPHATPSLN